MATTFVDDHNPNIVYGGYWSSDTSSSIPYDNTLTGTQIDGASAGFTFAGPARISVYGMIPPSGSGEAPSSSYSIDGSTPQVYDAVMRAGAQFQVQFYQSPQLSSGQHTLLITNLVEGGYFYLDYFLITTVSSVTTAAAAQNTPTAAFSASTSSPDASSQSSTAVLTRVSGSGVVAGSSTFTNVSTQTTNSFSSTMSTPHTSTTFVLGTSSSGSRGSSGGGSSSPTAASKTYLGPIVGGVIGGVALLTIIALIFFFRRRGRKMQGHSVHPLPPGPSSGVTPFSPPPNMSQLNRPEILSHPYGTFDRQLPADGRAGAAFLAHLPLAQVTGKRQVTAPDDRSASSTGLLDAHQRGEERPGGNATPSSGTTGTNPNRFDSGSHQGGLNGSSTHYPEETPPAY